MNQTAQTAERPARRVPRPRVDRDAYTLIEVADRLGGVSLRSVYNYIDKHGLKVVHIGSKPMVLRDDLAAFLAGARAGGK